MGKNTFILLDYQKTPYLTLQAKMQVLQIHILKDLRYKSCSERPNNLQTFLLCNSLKP